MEATAPQIVCRRLLRIAVNVPMASAARLRLTASRSIALGPCLLAPTNCVAKVLDGQMQLRALPHCQRDPCRAANAKPIWFATSVNNCDPLTGVNSNGTDCASSSAVCGVNTIGGGNRQPSRGHSDIYLRV